jgi:hypothetical protein
MDTSTIGAWAAIAQVASTVVTGVGVVISLYFSRKALQEAAIDRRLRHKPHLVFTPGGYDIPVEFVRAGRVVPGVDPDYAKKELAHIPDNALSVRICREPERHTSNQLLGADDVSATVTRRRLKSPDYGHLCNHGTGPALNTHVTWTANEVWIGSDSFRIDDRKQREAVYTSDFNYMPVVPWNIPAAKEGRLTRLPTFVEKDHERKLTRVDGILEITCDDIFGAAHSFSQEFRVFPRYRKPEPIVTVTFGEVAVPANYTRSPMP